MTAVVGILNKHAVALAADSAVTIDGENGRKIFNRANKIFTLSKYHPVGVMIYNSASFMATPWETIIKVYRKQLGEQSFPTMQLYVEDFIRFLGEKNYFTDDTISNHFFLGFSGFWIKALLDESLFGNDQLRENYQDHIHEIIGLLDGKSIEVLNQINDKEICPALEGYTFEEFEIFANEPIQTIIRHQFTQHGFNLHVDLVNRIKLIVYQYFRMKEEITGFTGLVFTGFGEEEIYPQLIPVDISFAIQNRLRYFIDTRKEAKISNEMEGAIRPFAQTDVIDTILKGVDPRLEQSYFKNFKDLFHQYNQEILNILGDANPLLSTQIRDLNIEDLSQVYMENNNRIKRTNFLIPLMSAVSSLSKEDLAEMAESLIYLTYLKRRITFAEESVGGPVDVALISKGDGFIWIKRKHYFRPELNQHFLNNYLNT
ncbi:MAG: hypothetical protein KBC43_06555 [Bacteroidales bacterium]|nr:hypothetical protein [Bacteroidales bacterium]